MKADDTVLSNKQQQHKNESDIRVDTIDYINILDYLEAIVRQWKMIFGVLILSATLSVIISLSLPNVYTSTALILPPQQDSGLMTTLLGNGGGIGGMAADLLGKGSPVDMYIGILNSENMRDMIIDRFKLMKVYDEKYRIDTYKALNKNVEISAGKKDGIIHISVNDEDPNRAAAMANAYVEELGSLLVKISSNSAEQNRSYLEKRLDKSKSDLEKAENELKMFQSKYKVFDIAEQSKGTIKTVAEFEGQLAAEEIKMAGIKSAFTDSSQEVKNQQIVINKIRSQIAKFEGNRPNGSIPSVGSVPDLAQQHLRLMREFKIQETLFEILTKQHELSKLNEAKDTTGIQVVQIARVPDKKSKPRRGLIVAMSTVVAGFFAVLYILFHNSVNQMSPKDLEQLNRIKNMLPGIPKSYLLFWK